MASSEFGRLPSLAILSNLEGKEEEKLTFTPKYVDDFSVIASYLGHIDRKINKLYELLLEAKEDELWDTENMGVSEEVAESSEDDLVPSDYQTSLFESGPSGRPLKRSRADFGPFPSFGPTDLPKNNPYFQ